MATDVKTLSEKQLIDLLAYHNTSDFAKSLISQYVRKNYLTETQWFYVTKMVDEAENGIREVASSNTTKTLNVEKLQDMFSRASEHLNYPKIRLQLEDGSPIVISRSGEKSKYSGAINITDGGYFGNNIWYGRITKDNQYMPSSKMNEDVQNLLIKLVEHPEETAKTYGKLTGNCCFCGRKLSDERSTDVGYGPICAEHWGLPWGE